MRRGAWRARWSPRRASRWPLPPRTWKGQEGWLFRSTVGHSLAMTLIIGGITVLEAYVLPGLAK